MKKPRRLLVAAVCVPFLTGCFGVVPAPLPTTPAERQQTRIRGVVVGEGESAERVQFDEIMNLDWAEDRVTIVGQEEGGGAQMVTRTFPFTSISAVLVRQLDAGKTSGVVGGAIVGAVMVLAILLSGSYNPGS